MVTVTKKDLVALGYGNSFATDIIRLARQPRDGERFLRVYYKLGAGISRAAAEEAVRLAERWGGDEGMARRAAILHDCTKYLELDDQLRLCRQYGVELDELEQQAVKLLHAKTGAGIARDIFGEPDEVYEAIFWHTTGRANMTLLDKILYMADYIEPNRDFDGVEELSRLAYTDLDQAMMLGVESTIQEMEQRGVPIHKNTLAARDWLKKHG